MATIYHQVGINASLSEVYTAIATTQGITGWWTKTSGDPRTGGDLEFSFNDLIVGAKVTANTPGKYIEWTVRGNEGEWLDTRICFELVEADGQVMVNFQHADWRDATEMLAHCTTKWAMFLLSLKDYLETGKGKPFPDDIHINHTVFN